MVQEGKGGGSVELVPAGIHSVCLPGEEPVTSTRGWSGTEKDSSASGEGEVKSSGGPSPQRLRADPGDPPPPHPPLLGLPLQTPTPQAQLPPPLPPPPPLGPAPRPLWAFALMLPLQSLSRASPCFQGAHGTLGAESWVSSPSGWGLSCCTSGTFWGPE